MDKHVYSVVAVWACVKVIFSTSSSSRRAHQEIKLCGVRGSLGRGQSVCKGGRGGQNEQQGMARRSSAGNGARETERLASVGGDGGIGSGTGDSGGSGGGSEGGGDGSKPLVPGAGLWSRFCSHFSRKDFS